MKLWTYEEWKKRLLESLEKDDKLEIQKLCQSFPDYHCAYIKEQE